MPKYLIERSLPGAGSLSHEALAGAAARSNAVLREMNTKGTSIEWVHSYVTGDKLYCVFNAPDETSIREHAKRGGFPVDRVEKVADIIDPKCQNPVIKLTYTMDGEPAPQETNVERTVLLRYDPTESSMIRLGDRVVVVEESKY